MKHSLLSILFIFAVSITFGQTKHTQAKQNETVWLSVYHVKADKRAQYEKFVHEIFWPGASKLSAAEQKVFRQTRVMHPDKAEADGTYNYSFLMDPVIKGADYNIESLVKKMYGAKQGAEYYKLFEGAITKENKTYTMIQSKD